MRLLEITTIKVKNIKGTSELKCKCDSWLQHWENFSSSNAKYCKVLKCTNEADVGAHVLKCNSDDGSHYIIPLCHSHNQIENDCFTVEKTIFISANISETCDAKKT